MRTRWLAISLALILSASGMAPGFAQVQMLEGQGSARVEAPAAAPQAVDAAPVPCATEDFTIAEMGWPSAAILAHIHAAILRAEFGCRVRLVTGDPAATLSSIATTRQPAVAPELWVSRHADIWNGAMRAQSARAAAPSFTGGTIEGWFVPAYVLENNPGLTGVEALNDYWQVFAPENSERAQLLSCPPDWACAMINADMLTANGLDERFNTFEPPDRFTLDSMLAGAVARREPVLTYYWQPNGLIDRLDLVALDMGSFDPGAAQCMALDGCIPFGTSSFAPDTVVIAVAEWVFTDAPDVANYFARASMPFAEMNRLLAWQASEEASPEAVAQHFLLTGREIWHQWVADTDPEDADSL